VALFFQVHAAKKQGKDNYIIHQVLPGETLSKISRQYGVSVAEILNVNPSLADYNHLSPGQMVRIPSKNKKKLAPSGKSSNELIPKNTPAQPEAVKGQILHTVEKGQTLYSISKMYNVTVQDVQKWNNLNDFNVKLGSQLVIKPRPGLIPRTAPAKPAPVPETAPAASPVKKEEPVTPSDSEMQMNEEVPETPDIEASDNVSQKELGKMFREKAASGLQTSRGTGAPMTTTLGAMETTYFAMHKTLPIGTVIKIKNLVNSRVVFAKVIGKLPDTDENRHVIVRYTLGVKKDLLLQNGKCYVQIEYPN
jgi:LysM repeat protein